jgi:hypothetical protein
MFGKVPAYTDISHFRAPYKNAYIAGYGAVDPSASNGAAASPEAAYVAVDKSTGYRTVRASMRDKLMTNLKGYRVIVLGGQFNNVKLQPYTAEEFELAKTNTQMQQIMASTNAAGWVDKQVKEKKAVFALTSTLLAVMTHSPLTEGSDTLGTFPAGSDEAKEAAKSPMGVVIAGMGGGLSLAMFGGPVGVAAIAAVAVGGVYYLSTRRGRSSGGSSMSF